MTDWLKGPHAKVERANEHIQELNASLVRFLGAKPYEAVGEREPETGDMVYRAVVRAELPARVGAVLGDAIHNLRSALDLVVWQLVIANKKVPTRHDAFPISDGYHEFGTTGLTKIKGRISTDAIEIIKGLKPYKGGNDALWRLHHLDIADKHRLLLAVAMNYREVVVPLPTWEAPDGTVVPGISIPLGTDGEPLEDGTELYRIKAAVADEKFDNQPEFRFLIAFGEPGIVEGEPLLPTLHQFAGLIAQTVELFAPVFPGE